MCPFGTDIFLESLLQQEKHFAILLSAQGTFFDSVVFILVELMVIVFWSYSHFYLFQERQERHE